MGIDGRAGEGIATQPAARRSVRSGKSMALSPFGAELKALVKESGLSQTDFLDELISRTEVHISASRFGAWLRGDTVTPSYAEADAVLMAARALTTEARRYPKAPVDVPGEVVREALKTWQKSLTIKQISVITGLPFITLRSWELGRHKRVRYAKWQQARQLMDLWTRSGGLGGSTNTEGQETVRQAVEIIRKHSRREAMVKSEAETTPSPVQSSSHTTEERSILSVRKPVV